MGTMDPTTIFGDPASWPAQDFVAFSPTLDERIVVDAYRAGLFPMPLPDSFFGPGVGWWSPLRRGVLPLARFHCSHSLRQSRKRYSVTVDNAFERVVNGCADPGRPGGWIDAAMTRLYRHLHANGVAHSVEAWTPDGELAGGLYGLSLGGLFAGESMFHRDGIGRDASKVALAALVDLLHADGVVRLLDVQWATPHLVSLGAIEISRPRYLAVLPRVLALPAPDWRRIPPAPGSTY